MDKTEKQDEKDNDYLPGFLDFFPEPKKEELEYKFWDQLFDEINQEECDRIKALEDVTVGYALIKELAKKYKMRFPDSIERELRQWKGKDAFEKIKRIAGTKQSIELFEQMHDYIPISLKGFTKTEKKGTITWTRKIGGKEITLSSIKPEYIPGAGDLAKRIFMGTCLFANERGTLDPGPIEFRELLELVGKLGCSQQERERIRRYLDSIKHGGLEVTRTDNKGREIYNRYAPFFKDFIWDGGLDYTAKIYPVFNERIFRMILEENISQYVWISQERIAGTLGLTDREQLAQDKFKPFLGLPRVNYNMRNFLYEFGQFTDARLSKLPLSEIKEFVNRTFLIAERNGNVKSHRIKRFQEKRKYLNQILWFQPGSPPIPPKTILTEDQLSELEEIANWLYEAGVEDYAQVDLDKVKENLMNAAKAGHLDCIRKAQEWVEYTNDPLYQVDDDNKYENRPMSFWKMYRGFVEKKKNA